MIPPPLLVISTLVALPPNKLLPAVTADVPHVVPLELLKVIVGGLGHPHDIVKGTPVVIHPVEFFTVIT